MYIPKIARITIGFSATLFAKALAWLHAKAGPPLGPRSHDNNEFPEDAFDATYYETVLNTITRDPRYLNGLDWGQARLGHPEGTVRAHIAQLERNLEHIKERLSDTEYGKLRILTHTHDTFKGQSERDVPITHPQSHASLARRFLSSVCADEDLCMIVQHHDEPFALWQQARSRRGYSSERFTALLRNINDWDVFLAFTLVDGCSEGKDREPLRWFFRGVEGKVKTRLDWSWLDH